MDEACNHLCKLPHVIYLVDSNIKSSKYNIVFHASNMVIAHTFKYFFKLYQNFHKIMIFMISIHLKHTVLFLM